MKLDILKINSNIIFYLALFVLYLGLFLIRSQQNLNNENLDLNELSYFNHFSKVRDMLNQHILNLLPSPQAELLSGILLGEKKDLPGNFKVALRDTSTLHIVVVSGQNLTMLAGVFMSLAGIFHKKTTIILTVCAIIFYTILTGAEIPVIRAAIMAILSYVAVILGRQKEGFQVLILSAGVMLLFDPEVLTNLSFLLSFSATFGVIVISPILLNYFKVLPNFISTDLAVTLSAQLMVIPIIAQNFHQISIVGVLVNLLVGWTIPFIMILGSFMLVFSMIFTPIAQMVAVVVNGLLTYFIYIVMYFGSLSFAWEYVSTQSWLVWGGYYMILFGITYSLYQNQD